MDKRTVITLKQLEEALAAGINYFYFWDDSKLAVYHKVEAKTGKKPLYDNHGTDLFYPAQRQQLELLLKEENIPLGQPYYVILR